MNTTVKTRRRFSARMTLLVLKISTATLFTITAAHLIVRGFNFTYDWLQTEKEFLLSKITRVEIVEKYIKPDTQNLEELLPKVAKTYHLPKVALEALISQESGNGTQLFKFEEETYARLKKTSQLSDSETRALSSSHGITHVMGFNAMPRCGVPWSRLYDTLIGLECGAKILHENLEAHKNIIDSGQRLWLAFRDYNGTGTKAENYANQVMAKVGSLLYKNLKSEF